MFFCSHYIFFYVEAMGLAAHCFALAFSRDAFYDSGLAFFGAK